MATENTSLASELEALAAPLIQSGRYANAKEVLHAAMDALRQSKADDLAFNEALVALAEEGEASGDAKGDVIGRIRAKYGFRTPVAR